MVKIFKTSFPLKEETIKGICENCIHRYPFKGITLCNIDTNPTIFAHNINKNPINTCVDYTSIDKSYPKLNIHAIWDWYYGFVYFTPVIVICKHDKPEYEYPSIEELYPHCFDITKDYNIKLKGIPWVVNLAEISETDIIKKYRTNIISDKEIDNILNNLK